MLRVLHLAHRHVSVTLLKDQLQKESQDHHTWVFVGAGAEHGAHDHWSLKPSDPLPAAILNQHWDAIMVHRMRFPTPKWLLSLPEGPFVLWASWGDDYFRVFPALSKGIILPKSRLLLGALLKFSVTILAVIQNVRNVCLPRSWKVTPRDYELAAMKRAHAIANLFGEDFIAKNHLPRIPEHLYGSWYNAVPKEISDVEASRDPEGPILLGSSASTTANHADFLFDHAAVLRAGNRELRMVLVYGSKRYARAIRSLASFLLGDQVNCLTKRLSLREYHAYLSDCPVVVHYHIRNQNTGNIVLSFLLGQRVLLRADGLAHRFFSELGFIVGDACSSPLDLSPLGNADREHNRSLALAQFSDGAIMKRYARFVADVQQSRL